MRSRRRASIVDRVEREQADEDPEEAHRVEREADAGARERDDDAADRRPEDPRHRAEARAERTAFGRSLRPDHLEDERVARRAVDRVDDPLEAREHEDLARRSRRPPSVSAASVAAITSETASQTIAVRRTSNRSSDRADEQAEHRHRQELDERERADRDRPSCVSWSTSHDGSDLLHPRAR